MHPSNVAPSSGPPAACASEHAEQGLRGPQDITANVESVFWVNSNGNVLTCAVAGCGGVPTKFAIGSSPFSIVADGSNVYWTDISAGTVLRCGAKTCSGTGTVLAYGQSLPNAIAVDATYVYWTNAGDGSVAMTLK